MEKLAVEKEQVPIKKSIFAQYLILIYMTNYQYFPYMIKRNKKPNEKVSKVKRPEIPKQKTHSKVTIEKEEDERAKDNSMATNQQEVKQSKEPKEKVKRERHRPQKGKDRPEIKKKHDKKDKKDKNEPNKCQTICEFHDVIDQP